MFVDFNEAIKKYSMNIEGVIIIGAFYGLDEEKTYRELGVKNMAFFEPSEFSFPVIRNNFAGKYPIYQVALGNENKKVILHSEKDNGGMSSSILTPKKHLEYYPHIHFPKEFEFEVDMKRLDEYSFGSEYNMISMDVQGYELEVLKGGIETLKHINYIYTEVNYEELYEGCVQVDELDRFLSDFNRVETINLHKSFGDALYIRRT